MKLETKVRTLIPSLLIVFAVLQTSQAVFPPPDGGYAGGNTAVGASALLNLTTGTFNTAAGLFSLESNTEGQFNTAIGAGTLLGNTADQNTATGAGALLSNTTGTENTANGAFTLFSNTSGFGNTAVGSNALFSNTTGGTLGTTQGIDVGPNTAVGASALVSNTTASANTAVGYQALGRNTSGLQDTDLGLSTAVGFQALANATGPGAGFNDAFGYQALFHLNAGTDNVAIGGHALFASTIGSNNVALGNQSGVNITTGNENICIGFGAGIGLTTGSNNIRIGDASGQNEDDTIRIGRGGVQTKTVIAGIFGAVIPGGTAVMVSGEGQLGTTTSSRRFKHEIKAMDKSSEALFALKPVVFHYKSDKANTAQFGLIAEEVAEANPELVVRDKEGNPYTVRYDAVNAMLLNEFLKEHKKVEEQAREIWQQKTEINRLGKTVETAIARIEEQDLKIRRVNEQIEINQFAAGRIPRGGPMRHTVRND
jgi:trimeric autotransporter adhesin